MHKSTRFKFYFTSLFFLIHGQVFSQGLVLNTNWPERLNAGIEKAECLNTFNNGNYLTLDFDPSDPSKGQFEQFYFSAKTFDPAKKTLIFIDGGPGQITGANVNTLRFENVSDFNAVYFHPRGVGCSAFPLSNAYDKYIRTSFIVEDLHQLKNQLGLKSWDIVWGLSFGTHLAMEYAHKYPADQKELILEGFFNHNFDDGGTTKQALSRGYSTYIQIIMNWPEFSGLDQQSVDAIVKFHDNFAKGNIVKPDGSAFSASETNQLIQSLFLLSYHGHRQLDSFNKPFAILYTKQFLRLLIKKSQVDSIQQPAFEKNNDLNLTSARVSFTQLAHDGIHPQILDLLSQGIDITKSYSDLFGPDGRYMAKDPVLSTTSRPQLEIDPKIGITILQGMDDGRAVIEGVQAYFSTVSKHAKIYGLSGYGHARHFSEECNDRIINTINVKSAIDPLLTGVTSSCYLEGGFKIF